MDNCQDGFSGAIKDWSSDDNASNASKMISDDICNKNINFSVNSDVSADEIISYSYLTNAGMQPAAMSTTVPSLCQTPKLHVKKWPPNRPNKKGNSAIVGDIDCDNVKAGTIYSQPQIIYVPGDYPDLSSALKSIKDVDNGGPAAGTIIILKPGCHRLTSDYNGDANFIRITAPESEILPTMSNFYGQNIGFSHKILQQMNKRYTDCEGGLGPYKLDICRNRITVTGTINPNFNRLKYGDILYFNNGPNGVSDHRVISAEFNTIWVSNLPGQTAIQEGDGFWISPRVRVEPIGNRQVINQSRMEWHGLHLQCPVDELNADDLGENQLSRFITGANSGFNRLRHCFVSGNISLIGSADSPYPNVYTGNIHHPNGVGGNTFYQAIVGCSGQLLSDGWNGTYNGATFTGNRRGVYNWNCGTIGLGGSSFLNCQLGAQSRFGDLNVPSCLFSRCDVAAECQAGKLNSRNEITSLPPLFIRNCNIGFSYNQSCRGDHRTVLTSNNEVDLIVDGTKYPDWSQFPSNSHGSGFSYLYYDQQIELPE